VVGIQNVGPRHPVLHTELDPGRQPADVLVARTTKTFVQAVDRLISRQHQCGTSGPIRMLSPAYLARLTRLVPAACSSLASRRIVSALLTSCTFERSPQPSTAPSLSAARRARPACSSLQWGARCRSFSSQSCELKRTSRGGVLERGNATSLRRIIALWLDRRGARRLTAQRLIATSDRPAARRSGTGIGLPPWSELVAEFGRKQSSRASRRPLQECRMFVKAGDRAGT